MPPRHTNREYEDELRTLRERLLLMAGRVEQMIANSVKALVNHDLALAKATIEEDYKVNRAEVDNDELCLLILAKRQPLASDLRFITLALKMVTDLERIGDLAVNICERAIDIGTGISPPVHAKIPHMAELAQSMVSEAIDAFVNGDADKAQLVIERDAQVDAVYHDIHRDMFALMMQDGTLLRGGVHLQTVSKYLERIGDHATNLAELVVFMVKGKDIRHLGKLDDET